MKKFLISGRMTVHIDFEEKVEAETEEEAIVIGTRRTEAKHGIGSFDVLDDEIYADEVK